MTTSRQEPITLILAGLLVLAYCIEGVLELGGLPHRLDLAVDAGEVGLCGWLLLRLVVDRTWPRVPWLVIAYLVWVATGLVSQAALGGAVTSLRNFTLLPVLALLIATQGTTERRARILVATLAGLCAFEFVVTIVQALHFGGGDSDAIVGTFGASANAVTAAVVLIAACVGIAGYLERAPWGSYGLVAAAVLPLFSAWTVVKIVPIILPVAILAVIAAAVLLRRTSWRRALFALAATLTSAGAVLGFYAAFRTDSFQALFDSTSRSNYARDAAIYQPPPVVKPAPAVKPSPAVESPPAAQKRPAAHPGPKTKPPKTKRPNQGNTAPKPTTETTTAQVPPPQKTPTQRPVPGRTLQWRMAREEIAGSTSSQLFGKGLGVATVAENLGVRSTDLSANADAASYSDFGTLLVERGWVGVVFVGVLALAMAMAAMRILRRLPGRLWSSALTLAVPGAVAVMAAYGMLASQLRSGPVALTFWLVIALGLSPGAFLGGRPWRKPESVDAVAAENGRKRLADESGPDAGRTPSALPVGSPEQ